MAEAIPTRSGQGVPVPGPRISVAAFGRPDLVHHAGAVAVDLLQRSGEAADRTDDGDASPEEAVEDLAGHVPGHAVGHGLGRVEAAVFDRVGCRGGCADTGRTMRGRIPHFHLAKLPIREDKTLHAITWKEAENGLQDKVSATFPKISRTLAKSEREEGDYTLFLSGFRAPNSAYMVVLPVTYTPPS